ncbi:MAG: hypothetical protein MZV49_11265 [Rhodopseudomonas palustris]|nr:hypothetical protein [Rhodopseudomonas palustris]
MGPKFAHRRDARVVELRVDVSGVAGDRLVPVAIGSRARARLSRDRRSRPGCLPRSAERSRCGQALGHVEAAVGRGTGQERVFERDRGRLSASTDGMFIG